MEPRAFPQRITFLAGTLGQGGAERQLFYILQALRAHGVGLRLLCLTQGEFWERRIREELHVPVTWVGRSGLRLGRLVRIVLELRRQLPDLIQSQHFFTNLYVAGAARILGRPEIGAIRNDVTSEVGGSLMGRLSLKSPRYLAANSQAAVATAIKMGVAPSRCSFLPNVVDTERFRPAPAADARELRLLAVGRLVEQKRLDRFIRVVGQVRQKTTRPVKAVIIGTGPERARLQQQVGESGLDGVVEFRGTIDNVAPEYQRADVFVLTSDWEGTPNVVLEAMASGLAVVSTPAGGVGEIVRHGETGLITRSPGENELSAAVLQLANDSQLRRTLGERARRYVQQCHSLEALPGFLKELYQKRNA